MRRLLLACVLAGTWGLASGDECLLLRHNSTGVVGMDGAASTALGDGRTLFAFGDTFFGSIDGEREISEIEDHSFAIVSNANVGECFAGARLLRDRVHRPPGWDERDRFWPGHGLRVDGAIVLFFVHARVTDPADALGFEIRAAGVVRGPAADPRFDLRKAEQLSPGLLPAALMLHEDFAYVYLCRPEEDFACVVARVGPDSLSDPARYVYYTRARGFSGALEDAATVLRASAEFSVGFDPDLGRFVAVNVEPFAREISMRLASAPQGPFGEARTLVACSVGDDEFCYGAKAHPQLAADGLGFLYVTYNTNLMKHDPRSYAARPRLYWPRLVRVDLSEVAD